MLNLVVQAEKRNQDEYNPFNFQIFIYSALNCNYIMNMSDKN